MMVVCNTFSDNVNQACMQINPNISADLCIIIIITANLRFFSLMQKKPIWYFYYNFDIYLQPGRTVFILKHFLSMPLQLMGKWHGFLK